MKDNTPINGNDLLALGYPHTELLGIALKANKKRTGYTKTEMLAHYKVVLANAEDYINHKVFGKLATAIIEGVGQRVEEEVIPLRDEAVEYSIYGSQHIEEGAIAQMRTAVKLPVAVAGALMPDAHQGYGLPIGGVLATDNAVIPYGVGVDIGCRMALSIFDIKGVEFYGMEDLLKEQLVKHTKFGAGHGFHGQYKAQHEVLDRGEFNLNPFIKKLQDKAWEQLGSSGGGNHFVEWGLMEFAERDEVLKIDKGTYLALLTHSGSRGMGATIAGRYTQIAKDLCKLPYEAKNLAYLDLNSEAGQEYWTMMNLAGDYASACHQVIHEKLTKAIGAEVLAKIENHHNFAWKEMYQGKEVIVHRKGATPASKGVMGIIPGSMTAPGFLVRGKGEEEALNSASHGAGRQMSRTQAIKKLNTEDIKAVLADCGVELIGAGKDEAPMAYKDIHQVIAAQGELVDVVAMFTPKIVRMADDGSKED
ncbi:RtcB family protein [Myroides sp. M-43]|uniref:RtcB family protein n=1 Tax=Myroides oncorhynchi TaxID=2893756 RepID=UPI001E5D88C3|nr:RtcB family protein [Myroides oncorhynchi]MCC9041549.1 RtcB family protein [Myroides oncorhynchi]